METKGRRVSSGGSAIIGVNISDSESDDTYGSFANFIGIQDPNNDPNNVMIGQTSHLVQNSSNVEHTDKLVQHPYHLAKQSGPLVQHQGSNLPSNGALIVGSSNGCGFESQAGMPRNMAWTTVKPRKPSFFRLLLIFFNKVLYPFIAIVMKALTAVVLVFGNLMDMTEVYLFRSTFLFCNIMVVIWISYNLFINKTLLLTQTSTALDHILRMVITSNRRNLYLTLMIFIAGLLVLSCSFIHIKCLLMLLVSLVTLSVMLGVYLITKPKNRANKRESEEKVWHKYLRPCSNCSEILSSVEKNLTKELSATYLSNQCLIHRPFFATTQSQCECITACYTEGLLGCFEFKSPLLQKLLGFGPRKSSGVDEHELTVVCTELSVDAAHVNDDRELYTWIHIPHQLKQHLRFFLSDVFVQCPTNPVWQCLSSTRCRKVLALRLLHHQIINEGGEKLQIKLNTQGKHLQLSVHVAFKYNGWPRGARQWMQQTAQHFLPRDILHKLISNGCYLVHDPCSDTSCCDNHALDWYYDFTQAIRVLMDYHLSKTALLLSFVILCNDFHEHLHYFRDYFRDLLQCLTYILLTKAQTPKRLYFGPMVAENITCLAKEMLRKLSNCLKRRRLRHYFVCNENILQKMSKDKIGALTVCTNKVFDGIHETVERVLKENCTEVHEL